MAKAKANIQAKTRAAPLVRRIWIGVALAAAVTALVAGRAALSCGGGHAAAVNPDPPAPIERLRVRVVRRHPHQRDAFTQGLVWDRGKLYESTGGEGQSSVRLVELETGKVLRRRDDDTNVFGEGLALAGDRLYHITWHEQRAFVLRADDFTLVREHRYRGEGWGLCYDGSSLVMSDGTDGLTFRDPDDFSVRTVVRVRLDGRPLINLNELECVDGAVWANVFGTDRLVRIDPKSGRVTASVDASGLLTPEERRQTDVLNGIAWMPETGRFLLTGKLWPWVFEVEFRGHAPSPKQK